MGLLSTSREQGGLLRETGPLSKGTLNIQKKSLKPKSAFSLNPIMSPAPVSSVSPIPVKRNNFSLEQLKKLARGTNTLTNLAIDAGTGVVKQQVDEIKKGQPMPSLGDIGTGIKQTGAGLLSAGKMLGQEFLAGTSVIEKSIFGDNKEHRGLLYNKTPEQQKEYEQAVFGRETKPLQESYKEIKDYAVREGAGPKEAIAFAGLGTIGLGLLESPVGMPAKSRIILKTLVEATEKTAEQELLKQGVSAAIAKELAPAIGAARSEKEVAEILAKRATPPPVTAAQPEWKSLGFESQAALDRAIKDVADSTASDVSDVPRRVLAGKITFKPGTGGDVSEWKDILGSQYYKVFKKDAKFAVDERVGELGYKDAEDLKNAVADLAFERYNSKPAPKPRATKASKQSVLDLGKGADTSIESAARKAVVEGKSAEEFIESQSKKGDTFKTEEDIISFNETQTGKSIESRLKTLIEKNEGNEIKGIQDFKNSLDLEREAIAKEKGVQIGTIEGEGVIRKEMVKRYGDVFNESLLIRTSNSLLKFADEAGLLKNTKVFKEDGGKLGAKYNGIDEKSTNEGLEAAYNKVKGESTLAKEAQKYSSAEEFVKAQNPEILRSSNTPRKTADEAGVYLTPNKAYASDYAEGLTASAGNKSRTTPKDGTIIVINPESISTLGFGDYMKSGAEYSDYVKLLQESGFSLDDAKKLAKNPKKAAENIDWRVGSDWMQEQSGYSEVVVDSVKWDDVVSIQKYENGKLVQEIKNPKQSAFDIEYDQPLYSGTPFDVTSQIKTKSQLEAAYNNAKTTQPTKLSREGVTLALNARERAIVAQADQSAARGSETIPTPRDTTTSPVSEARSLEQKISTQDQPGTIDIPESIKGDSTEVSAYKEALQKKILDAREAVGVFDDIVSVAPDPIQFPEQVIDIRRMANKMDLKSKARDYEDIYIIQKGFQDFTRNTEKVFKGDFKVIDKEIIEPLDASKGRMIDFYNKRIGEFKDGITKLGFRRNTKESAGIQLYGEGKVTFQELVDQFGVKVADNIVAADKWFRKTYDELITELNAVEIKIYPNNPEKWTPRHKNYYSHGQNTQNVLSKLISIMDNPIRIDPMLLGVEGGTKPLTKWQSFKQQRVYGKKTKPDALGGFLDYTSNVGYSIHIDPNIGRVRELMEELKRSTVKSKNLNNYIDYLDLFADDLAGKTSGIDEVAKRFVPGGRDTLAVADIFNKRVKANTILGSASSAVSQIFNVPQGIASAGKINSIKALNKTLAQNFVGNPEMSKSIFLKERYFRGFSQFDHGAKNNTKKFAVAMINVLDEAGTKFIWNGQYEKALELGAPNPIRYADTETRKLVAGRGIGEKSLMQNSKLFQIIAPFQHEVTNLWLVMNDMKKETHFSLNKKTGVYEADDAYKQALKKFDKFATLFVSLYLFNNVSEKITGHRVALDPIQAVLDGIEEIRQRPNMGGAGRAVGRLAGEVLSNIPIGQSVAASPLFPEYGGNVMGVNMPSRKELFGKADPTRFGGGLLSTKALQDPLYKILPPFGGSQLKKTIQGTQAVLAGKSTDKAGTTQFEVGGSPIKDLQALAFGKYSSTEARSYFDGTGFAESLVDKVEKSSNPIEELNKILSETPEMGKKMEAVIKKRALGLTPDEEKIKNMRVENKQRAQEVAKQINKEKDPAKKGELILDFINKKIITDDVAKQLMEFIEM
jgi:hypothetical protein